MTKYFKAVFSNGLHAYRCTESRHYTFAWCTPCGSMGFSSTRMGAHLACKGGHVVGAVEITAKEYRAGKAGG